MLTREHALSEACGDRLEPDRLYPGKHPRYVGRAAEMLRIFSQGIGKTRQELRNQVRHVFIDEPDCHPRRIESFCKLLEDKPVSTFATDRRGKAAALRCRAFAAAAGKHPLVKIRDGLFESEERVVKEQVARELGRDSWTTLEPELFADVFEYNTLVSFSGFPSPEALLSRYNVAQVQAALFDATGLIVRAREDLKQIVSLSKLARLLVQVAAPPPGQPSAPYVFRFDGPASVIMETRRYGVNMANFLPGLLACRGWALRAEIKRNRKERPLHLDLEAGTLRSAAVPPAEFDSKVEEGFARKWGAEARGGWVLKREDDLLACGQTVLVPDFTFHHADGRKVLFEIAAYWTREYIQSKRDKINLFPDAPLLLAIPAAAAKGWPDMPPNVLLYKTAIKINDVLSALARVAPPVQPGP